MVFTLLLETQSSSVNHLTKYYPGLFCKRHLLQTHSFSPFSERCPTFFRQSSSLKPFLSFSGIKCRKQPEKNPLFVYSHLIILFNYLTRQIIEREGQNQTNIGSKHSNSESHIAAWK